MAVMQITETTKITDAVALDPAVAKIFQKYDLYCLECRGMINEEIRHIAKNHGLNLERLLNELNSVLK